VSLDLRRCLTPLFGSALPLIDLARLHDLTVLPAPEPDQFGSPYVQPAIFSGGHPAVILPLAGKTFRRLDTIMVAWDYSREAARTLSDAMPLLERARQVHVVTVSGEKGIHTTCTETDLDKFLSGHGLSYVLHRPSLKSGSIGEFLQRQAMDLKADMLVMGAYGHNRLQEFVLGGATRGILKHVALPTFLSR
jgi:nucleotide-binding universal stress UspA family protein